MLIFYCPNCWSHVKEDEKICHKCKADIEPLDHRAYYEKLVNALNHPEKTARIRAAYILGELRDRRALKPLADITEKKRDIQDVFVVVEIAVALGKIGGEEALPPLVRLLDHPSFVVRIAALHALGRFKSGGAVTAIKKALSDPSISVQELARNLLKTR